MDGLGMAQNQTVPTKASVKGFVDGIPDEAMRADARVLVRIMREATGEKPVMWGPGIVGFGSYHYKYESGREGDSLRVGFAPRKSGLVIYLMHGAGHYATQLARLGKHKVSGSCLHVKRLADVDEKVLRAVVGRAAAEA
jgi:hypothetical protein